MNLLGGLMILIVFVFPLISKYVVKPYTAKVFHNDYAVISYENIVLTILMVVFIFVIPIANYFLIAKNRPFPKADRYFNGVGTPDQVGFINSFGNEKKEFLTNWYENVFLLGLLSLSFLNSNRWSILLAIVCIAVCYLFEILVDNTNARFKWKQMLDNTWIVTAVLGALNLIVIEVLKGKGVI